MAQQLSTNTFTVAKIIVSPDATQGTHITMAAALASAISGDTVFVRDGIYTENWSGKAGVTVSALSAGDTPTVTFIGTITYTDTGTFTINGCRLQTNGSSALSVSGSNVSIFNINHCYINATNSTAISFTNSNAASILNLYFCDGDVTAPGSTLFTQSSIGTFNLYNGNFNNSGNSTTANTVSAGSISFENIVINSPVTSSGTSALIYHRSRIVTSALNVIATTVGGSGVNRAILSTFSSGTATSVSISTTFIMASVVVTSSNAVAITGAGTLSYGGLSFVSSSVINVVTQVLLNAGPSLSTTSLTFNAGTDLMSAYIENGTYTPTLTGSTVAGTTTYTTQAGFYTQIGKRIFVDAKIVYSAATGTGNMQFSLPFASRNTANHSSNGVCSFINVTTPTKAEGLSPVSNIPCTALVNPGTSVSLFFASDSGAAGSNVAMGAPAANPGTVNLSITYLLA